MSILRDATRSAITMVLALALIDIASKGLVIAVDTYNKHKVKSAA